MNNNYRDKQNKQSMDYNLRNYYRRFPSYTGNTNTDLQNDEGLNNSNKEPIYEASYPPNQRQYNNRNNYNYNNSRIPNQVMPPFNNQMPDSMPSFNNQMPDSMPSFNNQMPGSMPSFNNQMPGSMPSFNNQMPGSMPPFEDQGPEPLAIDFEEATIRNNNFRQTIWTGQFMQITLMSIEVASDIGYEVHDDLDQFLYIEDGEGLLIMGDSMDNLDMQISVYDDYGIVIPAGTAHNVINEGNEPLKIFSIYTPPAYPRGTVNQTREESMASEEL